MAASTSFPVPPTVTCDWAVGARYALGEMLGKGSYGQVATAKDLLTGRRVAIKRISGIFAHLVDTRRLLREIHLLRHLNHPNVVALQDIIYPPAAAVLHALSSSLADPACSPNPATAVQAALGLAQGGRGGIPAAASDVIYLVFQQADTDLHKLVTSPQHLSELHMQTFLYQLLCAVRYLHAASIIHRDLKPANILVNEDCTLLLCDFGLARAIPPLSPSHRGSPRADDVEASTATTTAAATAATSITSVSRGGGAQSMPHRPYTVAVEGTGCTPGSVEGSGSTNSSRSRACTGTDSSDEHAVAHRVLTPGGTVGSHSSGLASGYLGSRSSLAGHSSCTESSSPGVHAAAQQDTSLVQQDASVAQHDTSGVAGHKRPRDTSASEPGMGHNHDTSGGGAGARVRETGRGDGTSTSTSSTATTGSGSGVRGSGSGRVHVDSCDRASMGGLASVPDEEVASGGEGEVSEARGGDGILVQDPPAKRARFTLPDGSTLDDSILTKPTATATATSTGTGKSSSQQPMGTAYTTATGTGTGSVSSGTGKTPTSTLSRSMTKHVVTRFYRAPELILLQDYGMAVDMWSVGCVFAELLAMQAESIPHHKDRRPLFPGRSCFPLSADNPTTYADRMDQLNVILNVLGSPSPSDIAQCEPDVQKYLRRLTSRPRLSINKKFPGASPAAIDLLLKLLEFSPSKRITVQEAIEHPFLRPVRSLDPSHRREHLPPPSGVDSAVTEGELGLPELQQLILQEVVAFHLNNRHTWPPTVPGSARIPPQAGSTANHSE